MTFDEYQTEAHKTALPQSQNMTYLILGLVSEVGEIADKVKKHIRDGHPLDTEQLLKEEGDALWYLSELSLYLDHGLDYVARTNLEKLRSRKQRGVLGGSGDNR